MYSESDLSVVARHCCAWKEDAPVSRRTGGAPLPASHGANWILAWRAGKAVGWQPTLQAAPTKRRIDQIHCLLRVVQAFVLSLLVISPVSASPSPGSHIAKQIPVKTINDQASQVFLSNLRARIFHNWLAPDGKNIVVIEATVNPNGDVISTTTAASSADSLAIAAATTAFEKAQPLGQLPNGYNSNCKITLTFNSNVDPHGDSTSNLTSRIDQVTQREPDSAHKTQ